MSTVTTLLNLVKPTTAEQFSLATLNNNMDIIDAAFPQIDYASSTFDNGTWDLTITKFTRLRMGTKGLVLVDMVISLPAVALPANTASAIALVGVIPAGFAGLTGASVPLQPANTGNSGTGSGVQVGFKMSDKSFQIRSGGAGFTTVAGSTLTWSTTYRWDGSLT